MCTTKEKHVKLNKSFVKVKLLIVTPWNQVPFVLKFFGGIKDGQSSTHC